MRILKYIRSLPHRLLICWDILFSRRWVFLVQRKQTMTVFVSTNHSDTPEQETELLECAETACYLYKKQMKMGGKQ